MEVETQAPPRKDDSQRKEVDSVVIRFAGDSGDGMQVTGSMFTHNSALAGNDISTFPDFPSEIRAPAGTLPGVSGFQLNFSSHDIMTPGDAPDVLVAMNPAALKVNLGDLVPGGTVIVNTDTFRKNNLVKAGYETSPLEDNTLSGYHVIKAPLASMTQEAVKDTGISSKFAGRCKNMFALGMTLWMYDRSLDATARMLEAKFAKKPEIAEANKRALQAGYNFADTTEVFTNQYRVAKAALKPGMYRMITGNEATVLGLVAATQLSGVELVLGSYPITPASQILEGLSNYKGHGVKTFQAEDEISAIGVAIGASFAGSIGLTTTSGPGLALKGEALGLAVMTELPLVVVNVQRGGPSTGLPTKTEQSDLLQALYGRNGDCPLVVLAPATPAECFDMAIEATRIALEYMVPVVYLSDGFLANGAEPWRIPRVEELSEIQVSKCTTVPEDHPFRPYERNPDTLARPWATPGTPGLEHRIGGLEKDVLTGNVSYDPENHQRMTDLRAEKVVRVGNSIPEARVSGEPSGKLLVVSWGGTHGSVRSAVARVQAQGGSVSHVHLRYLNPFPKNLGEIFTRFEKVLVPELNMGQLQFVLRATYDIEIEGLNKVQGQPFRIDEIQSKIEELI